MSSDSEEHLVPFYPSLPIELIREVVEHVALTDKSSAASLALVSRNFYNWTTPLMYHTVTLDTLERMLSFIHCIEAAQCFSVDNTKHIFSLAINNRAMQFYDWTLSLCGKLRSLLLWPNKWHQPSESQVEGMALWSHPWHVVILDVPTMWLIQRVSLFAHTSHLYLHEVLDPLILQICLEMRTLTHICFGLYGDHDSLEIAVRSTNLLLQKPSMELVLVHAFISGVPIEDFYGGIWASLAEIADERLFVTPGLCPDQMIELFESGETVWDSVREWKDWRRLAQPEELVLP